ncbi:hypothetical protein, partial [Rodentibacter rarus]|uniref:hypothetical protein n=1 Tax=Rodentibacter rarus TaxID=1908260 RepID=UPI001ABF829D
MAKSSLCHFLWRNQSTNGFFPYLLPPLRVIGRSIWELGFIFGRILSLCLSPFIKRRLSNLNKSAVKKNGIMQQLHNVVFCYLVG